MFRQAPSGSLFFAVLDSAGGTVTGTTPIGSVGTNVVGTQLSDGQVALAWVDDKSVKSAGLDSAFNMVSGPTTIPGDPDDPQTGEYYNWGTVTGLAATFDNDGHAVLTWVEGITNLYYTLIDAAGVVATPPAIMHTSASGTPSLFTSSFGQGNTTHHFVPFSGVDLAVAAHPASAGVVPGDTTPFDLRVTNYGLTIATGIQLTATLDGGLSYITDTSGITPTLAGNIITWALPALTYSEFQAFSLTVALTSTATLCTHYPIGLETTSAQTDANPADNTAAPFVFVPCQTFLPTIYTSGDTGRKPASPFRRTLCSSKAW
jgi:uncharacterized repeat protein (TIGR01451 family)